MRRDAGVTIMCCVLPSGRELHDPVFASFVLRRGPGGGLGLNDLPRRKPCACLCRACVEPQGTPRPKQITRVAHASPSTSTVQENLGSGLDLTPRHPLPPLLRMRRPEAWIPQSLCSVLNCRFAALHLHLFCKSRSQLGLKSGALFIKLNLAVTVFQSHVRLAPRSPRHLTGLLVSYRQTLHLT